PVRLTASAMVATATACNVLSVCVDDVMWSAHRSSLRPVPPFWPLWATSCAGRAAASVKSENVASLDAWLQSVVEVNEVAPTGRSVCPAGRPACAAPPHQHEGV